MTQNERMTTPFFKKVLIFILSLILIALQGLFFYYIFYSIRSDKNIKYVYSFFDIISAILALRLMSKDINIGYKLTWLFFILVFPLMGTVIYLIYADGRSLPKKKQAIITEYLAESEVSTNYLIELKNEDRDAYKLAKILFTDTNLPVLKHNNIVFYKDGISKHNALLDALKTAKKYIFLEYFIIFDGEVLDDVISILEEKGKAGIEIKFLYDSVGSAGLRLSKKTIKKLVSIPNLVLVDYNPLGVNFNFVVNYRDHRKIVVIDGITAFVGGDNLADEYVNKYNRFGYWRDNAIQVNGEAVRNFITLFAEMWYMSCKQKLNINKYDIAVSFTRSINYILPFGDGPSHKEHCTYDLYMSMFAIARDTLYISTPYFIIDSDFIDAIARSKKRGVDVIMLTPKTPDKKLVFQVTRSNYIKLLSVGVKIYEYSPGFNHAKNVIVDGKYAYVGTSNMDYRSLFLHFECGALLLNCKVIDIIEQDFLNSVKDSEQFTLNDYKKIPWWQKLFGFFAKIINPAL